MSRHSCRVPALNTRTRAHMGTSARTGKGLLAYGVQCRTLDAPQGATRLPGAQVRVILSRAPYRAPYGARVPRGAPLWAPYRVQCSGVAPAT